MKEPFRKIWFTLVQNHHPAGQWHYNVKLTNNGEAIYIGDDANHCTVLKDFDGYHHTENGTSQNGQHEAYTTIERMLERVEYNPQFYSNGIRDALVWLRNNQSSM